MAFTPKTTPTQRQPKAGKYSNIREYRNRWYRPSGPIRQQLHAAFVNDRERYFLSYQPNDEDIIFFQETGMEAFIKMERKLLRRMRFERYYKSGEQAMDSLGAALGDYVPSMDRPKVVFVSLDFEYNASDSRQIREFGFAKINSKQLLCPNDSRIASFNFTLRNQGNGKRKFMFGNSTRLSLELRERTIVDFITELSNEDPQSQIMFVGHNLVSEIRVLDDIGLPLETLPIAGILDTCHLAIDIPGSRGSLDTLLTTLMIPYRPDLLHCAGNDAHYTLQALLALIQARYGDKYGRLQRFTKLEVPLQPCCLEEKADEDWTENLELSACLSMFQECEDFR